MIRSRPLLVIIVIAIAGIAYLISWFSSTVAIKVTIFPDSEIKTGLVATTSKDGHKKLHKLPYSTRVKPGEYTVTAWGNGSSIETGVIKAERGGVNSLVLRFTANSGDSLERLFSNEETYVPLLNLFPYETVNYLITATDNGKEITSINIAAKHRFTNPNDVEAYKEEREIVVELAKKWLKENNVPETIETTITDY